MVIGLRRAPALVGLQARGEEVDVALERRLEHLVPVHEVGQQRQGLRVQRVEAGAEDVGDAAFVDERRHLRFANGQLAAVLDLHVLHGIAVGEDAVLRFGPLDDVDELFRKEVSQAHDRPLPGARALMSISKDYKSGGPASIAGPQ